METRTAEDFARHVAGKPHFAKILTVSTDVGRNDASGYKLRSLWEASDMPAHEFADEVASFYGLPRLGLPQLIAATPAVERFSPRFLRETALFPFRTDDGRFKIAVGDPSDQGARRAAEIVFGDEVRVAVASFEDIATALNTRLGSDSTASEDSGASAIARNEDVENLRDLASGAPVIRAVNDLMERAIEQRASDIHIEPFRKGLVLRMRVDGLLRVVPTPAGVLPQALISRIKILANLDIAERRLPQDGAARLTVARTEIDIRVATMPTQNGESAVIRLLPRDRGLLELGKLGLAFADERLLSELLALPHGMVVITGPTGSGKTTTLATMLSALNTPSRKILTVEDPVEYEIHGVNQSQVKPSIGLTFAAAMRAFVRQDPDVIMVGEVRDAETAHIAIHAALTGHLVLTTLHTETAAAAVPRLLDLGVESFLLKSSLRAVIAQRLVRVLCDRCKTQRHLAAEDLVSDPRYGLLGFLAGDRVHEPAGCERCGHSGYRGRVGVFEILRLNDEVADLIGSKADARAIDRAACRGGMTTMIDDAVLKCRTGVTSPAEVLRVTTVR